MGRYGYSLADLAVVADTHRSAISHLVEGRGAGLRADRAARVAAALHVDLSVLFIPPNEDLPVVRQDHGRTRPPRSRCHPGVPGGARNEPREYRSATGRNGTTMNARARGNVTRATFRGRVGMGRGIAELPPPHRLWPARPRRCGSSLDRGRAEG